MTGGYFDYGSFWTADRAAVTIDCVSASRKTHNGQKTSNSLSASAAPDVSVIIVNWNLKDELGACIDSLKKSGGALQIETIVVDNGSTDGSAEMVERDHPGVRLIHNSENIGFSRANNQAMAVAAGRYYFLLNNDTLIYRQSLPQLVEFMERHADVGICGPRVVNGDGTLQIRSKGRYPTIPRALAQYFLPSRLGKLASGSPGFYDFQENMSPQPMDWISGCALLARRTAVEEVGMLDADIFMYLEDVDWCYRMKQAGWQVWNVPGSVVLHYGGRSMNKQSGRAVGAHAAGLVAFYTRYHGRFSTFVFRLILGAGYSVQALGWLVSGLFGRGAGMDKIKRMARRRDADLGK